ncbi:uncharacterized protein LOC122879521 isoform X2 [Siniperca chuatsi]|uniref:uncharacterized protein LOC122879521 isoform X2 n=1 Tax=Siniperca chuatsi TaxID=119488 RepID=UPI001CE09562|nr:uncharacterized protein LOC122879521 isoform X2 [Siniperca chuatsi]
MHQHTHQYAFTPILHQSLTILPAPVGTQDSKFNTHPLRGTTKSSFAPVTAFHRATQKFFRPTKRVRWGALHVCIAWKIYYHEQLKKMQQKPKTLHREGTPEYPASSLPDSVQHKESDQPSCRHPNLASCLSRTTKREQLDREKLEHRGHQTDTTKDLPLRDKSWDRRVTPELDGGCSGSLDRKRQLECDSVLKVKRVKREIVENHFDSSKTLRTDPSPFSTTHTHPSSHTVPVQHINTSDLSVLYPNSSRCNVTRAPGGLISYAGAEMHPYQTASWEPMLDAHKRMDLHSRQNVLKDNSLNTCKAIRIPLAAQWQKEAFHGFFMPPLYPPLALRQQETVYLRGREFLHSRHENCHLHHCRHHLPHPGFLATSYLGR